MRFIVQQKKKHWLLLLIHNIIVEMKVIHAMVCRKISNDAIYLLWYSLYYTQVEKNDTQMGISICISANVATFFI